MTNNDVLRKIRYVFDYSDKKMMSIFKEGELEVTREQLSNFLKKDDAEDYKNIFDKQLAHFLNGFIIEHRGKREGPSPKAEKSLNNNIVLRKLKIALNLKVEDIVDLIALANIKISKHEITAFFRKPGQSQYRPCLDQFLRHFLLGLQLKYRKPEEE
ncbi:DUF1456 family protein [Chitinophagales bacterium]|nr:DUF1456 family protein [Chitinophagales bacterium]